MARFAIVVQGGKGIKSGVREGRRGPEADTAKGGNKEKEEPAAFDVGVNLNLHYSFLSLSLSLSLSPPLSTILHS